MKEAESLTDERSLCWVCLNTKKRARLCEPTLSIETASLYGRSYQQQERACFSHHVSFWSSTHPLCSADLFAHFI